MASKRENEIIRIIASLMGRLLAIGEFWFLVWIFNPPLTTSTVWFCAILYSSIQASLVSILGRIANK